MSYLRNWESSQRTISLKEKDGWLWDVQLIAAHKKFGRTWEDLHHMLVAMSAMHMDACELSWEAVYMAFTTNTEVRTFQIPS
jgi:hypothetical protein